MSQINVNTINEYATANGVTIDGVLVKDGAIAKSYISGELQGLTNAQQWVLTATISTTGTNDITTNLANPSANISGQLGSLVSESSGIFSFSETGIYGVLVNIHSFYNQDGAYAQVYIMGTNDNTNYTRLAYVNSRGRSSTDTAGSRFVIVDIQDTANDKIKFQTDITTNGNVIGATSTANANTSFVFFKLGET